MKIRTNSQDTSYVTLTGKICSVFMNISEKNGCFLKRLDCTWHSAVFQRYRVQAFYDTVDFVNISISITSWEKNNVKLLFWGVKLFHLVNRDRLASVSIFVNRVIPYFSVFYRVSWKLIQPLTSLWWSRHKVSRSLRFLYSSPFLEAQTLLWWVSAWSTMMFGTNLVPNYYIYQS